ncbi:glycine-rich RNA-binding protein 5 [Prunus dulcis]|uniref:Glycine-rich RNA-binding protein 5 n=1 Tax=Prunus dulcis TaxID=3755 RepID=A0A4Y1RLR3_PRUDU|nr:glycine-rich RNA-binding protein 5 [Prunus dulcis]
MRGSNGGFGILRTSALGRSFWARHSSTNLFVGGLSYDTNEPVLKEAFGKHGEIIEVKVICDHVSGKSKGYGFVKFTSGIEASTALKEMDGQMADKSAWNLHTRGNDIDLRYSGLEGACCGSNPWNAKKIRPEQVSLNASLRLQEFLRVNECLGSHSGQGQTKQKWQTPHANTLKINVDGAWKPGTTEGGVGVVVIDSTGKFVAGCAVKCILCTTSGGFGCKNKYSIGNGKVTP